MCLIMAILKKYSENQNPRKVQLGQYRRKYIGSELGYQLEVVITAEYWGKDHPMADSS